MSWRPWRNHSSAFKSNTALSAIKGEQTEAELAQQFDIHLSMKTLFLDRTSEVFEGGEAIQALVDVNRLHAKISKSTLDNDFLETALTKAGVLVHKTMIDRIHTFPVSEQAKVQRLSRGCLYYPPNPVFESDQTLMNHMDQLHVEFPFARARILRDLLRKEGFTVHRKHVATLSGV